MNHRTYTTEIGLFTDLSEICQKSSIFHKLSVDRYNFVREETFGVIRLVFLSVTLKKNVFSKDVVIISFLVFGYNIDFLFNVGFE